ncbi:MAG: sugar phosphate isomerase/epimerase [bacterium]|nr:sugar phosphate isomerase/epimerase [bacterium]
MEITWKWAACGYTLMGYKSTEEVISLCKYAGISAIEMNTGFINGKDNKEIEKMAQDYKNNNIILYSFHLPFTEDDDISAFYEIKRKEVVKKMSRLIEQVSILGNKVVILHPTTNYSDVNTEGIDRYLYQLGRSLEVLLPEAEKLNLTIAIENMPPNSSGTRFGSLPEHFTIMTKKFSHPNFGFCLDTGHANISVGQDGPNIFFEVMKKNIVAFHLQDNPGDRDLHIAPGYGRVNWKDVFTKMSAIRFTHPACIETPPFGYLINSTYTPDDWRELFDKVDSLARNILK